MDSRTTGFTYKQGQYLAFIHAYVKLNRHAPAESDFQRYFRVSPPTVHNMIKTLTEKGLIERNPGVPRSIRLSVDIEKLPPLDEP
jgi:Mn-dependent DtxR family transcriptional regulator